MNERGMTSLACGPLSLVFRLLFNDDTAVEHTRARRSSELNRRCAGRRRTDSPPEGGDELVQPPRWFADRRRTGGPREWWSDRALRDSRSAAFHGA
jgi:hypothetical protein